MGTRVPFTCTLLCTLLTTGLAIQCTVCRSEGGESSCSGEDKECGKDFVCASTSTITTMEGMTTKSFTRTCARRSNCGVAGNIVFYGGYSKMATSCCYTDLCFPTTPVFAKDGIRPNGLTCQSCTSLDSNWCLTKETVQCTGEENKCILQRDTYSGKKYSKTAMRGCSTKAICDLGSQTFNYGGVSLRREITCTNRGLNLHANVLLVVLGAFLTHRLIL